MSIFFVVCVFVGAGLLPAEIVGSEFLCFAKFISCAQNPGL
jgi:hypothetical protein